MTTANYMEKTRGAFRDDRVVMAMAVLGVTGILFGALSTSSAPSSDAGATLLYHGYKNGDVSLTGNGMGLIGGGLIGTAEAYSMLVAAGAITGPVGVAAVGSGIAIG